MLTTAAFALCLVLSSCSDMFNTEFYKETSYVEGYFVQIPETDIREVYNYSGMRDALVTLIAEHADGGTIRTRNYSGNVNDDISKAIDYVRTETPLGNYAVEFISQKPKEFLSYYEIEIHIVYKRDIEEIEAIIRPAGAEVYDLIDEILDSFEPTVTFEVTNTRISEALLISYIEKRFEDHPELMPEMPEISAVAYPNMANLRKIVTLEFHYSYSKDVLSVMRMNYVWKSNLNKEQPANQSFGIVQDIKQEAGLEPADDAEGENAGGEHIEEASEPENNAVDEFSEETDAESTDQLPNGNT